MDSLCCFDTSGTCSSEIIDGHCIQVVQLLACSYRRTLPQNRYFLPMCLFNYLCHQDSSCLTSAESSMVAHAVTFPQLKKLTHQHRHIKVFQEKGHTDKSLCDRMFSHVTFLHPIAGMRYGPLTWSVFWLTHPGEPFTTACISPSQVPPMTGLLQRNADLCAYSCGYSIGFDRFS